jgi:phage shock protein E
MKKYLMAGAIALIIAQSAGAQTSVPNPEIDYPGFRREVQRVESIREARRLTEAQFLKAMAEPGVILLDARSPQRFRMRHIKGAVNLDFTEFTAAELSRIIPNKNTKILIYCNNNFSQSLESFPTKIAPASLNLSTYVSLSTYGYTNIYELGPTLNVRESVLPFEGTEIAVIKQERTEPLQLTSPRRGSGMTQEQCRARYVHSDAHCVNGEPTYPSRRR